MARFKNWQKIALLLLLALVATISTLQGFNNALQGSQDFQWSPSVLFWEGVNPYTYYLNGNENNRIILSQAPNYAHLVSECLNRSHSNDSCFSICSGSKTLVEIPDTLLNS